MHRVLGLIAAMLALVAGGTGTALAQDATPMAGAATEARFPNTMGLPELAITVTDAAYEGVPAETAAGRYVVTLTNTGSDEGYIHFMQLPAGETVETLFGPPPGAEGTPMAGMEMATPVPPEELGEGTPGAEEGGDEIPPWFYEVYHAGGPGGVAPGGTVQGIIDLIPGNYIVWGGDPEQAQAPVPLTVTGDAMAGTPMAGMDMGSPMAGMEGMAEPTADVTVTETGTAGSFHFELEGSLQPGPNVIEIYNDSDQPHFMELIGYPEPITMDQVQALLTFDPSMGTPPPGMLDETLFFTGAFANVQSAGTTQWLAADLQPGYYILACFVGDPTRDGIPHAFEGMIEIVQVGDGGAMATPAA